MKDALLLLTSLRRFSEQELMELIARRHPPQRSGWGLIDAVEWLLTPRHIDAALERLGWRACLRLTSQTPDALREAHGLGLAVESEDGQLTLPEAVRKRLERLKIERPAANEEEEGDLAPAEGAERARSAGALAADVLDLLRRERHAAHACRDGTPSASDIRRIAGQLAVDPGELMTLTKPMIRAQLLGIASDGDERLWSPTERGVDFLNASPVRRWRVLAEAWLDGLGLPEPGKGPLDEPGAAAQAALLGLADAAGRPGKAGRAVLREDLDGAELAIARHLPDTVTGVYVQADLTVIAPGPLSARDEADLRSIARLEQRGIASVFRIDAGAVTASLSAGANGEELLAALGRLSLTGIPQPVRYLIETTARDHGRVRVRAEGTGSIVRALDTSLIDRIAVDQALTPLGGRRHADGTLSTGLPPRTTLALLLNAGYRAAAESEDGQLQPIRPLTADGPGPREYSSDIARLAAQWRAESHDGDLDEHRTILQRRLELARRAKRPVRLRITMPNEASRELVMVPTSVLPERMRGRDASAGLERTMPLSAITHIEELPG